MQGLARWESALVSYGASCCRRNEDLLHRKVDDVALGRMAVVRVAIRGCFLYLYAVLWSAPTAGTLFFVPRTYQSPHVRYRSSPFRPQSNRLSPCWRLADGAVQFSVCSKSWWNIHPANRRYRPNPSS